MPTTDGRQCGSPALRHEKLCYQHHAAARPARGPLGQPVLPTPKTSTPSSAASPNSSASPPANPTAERLAG